MSRSQYTYYVIILGGWWWRGQGNDYLDYAGGGVQNWAKVDYIICAHSLIHVTVRCSTVKNCVDLSSIDVKIK